MAKFIGALFYYIKGVKKMPGGGRPKKKIPDFPGGIVSNFESHIKHLQNCYRNATIYVADLVK